LTERSAEGEYPSAAIVSVGDELLLGHTVNTNGSWLAGRLSGLGLHVVHQITTRDHPSEIRDGVSRALDLAENVFVTGGLGPTPDDLTRDAVAELLGLPLETDSHLLERIRDRSRSLAVAKPPPGVERMALVPSGATVIANPHGAAPGLLVETGSKLLALLPGIPREMRDVFAPGMEAFLLKRLSGRLQPVLHRMVHTAGIPESRLAERIEEALGSDRGPVSLAYLPHAGGVRVRLSVRAWDTKKDADAWLDRAEARLAAVLGPYRYEARSGHLAEAVGEALRASGRMLAVAESCTGGLISKLITDQAGSSAYFLGGVVAYANSVKVGVLGVPESVLDEKGAVSEEVALAMARGVSDRFGSGAGIGVTGVAGPTGGTEDKPAGTVWYAAVLDGVARARRARFPGDREAVRTRAGWAAMLLLLQMLEET
jgi:nicotinamide-nucleotide amidase